MLRKTFLTLCSLSAIAIMSQAVAAHTQSHDTGFYGAAGVGGGWSSAQTQSFTKVTQTTAAQTGIPLTLDTLGQSRMTDASGLAAIIDMGYQFHYFAAEVAYTHAPEFTENETGTLFVNGTEMGGLNSNDTSSINYLSFLGKASYPFAHVRPFAGAGMAIVFKDAHTRTSDVLTSFGDFGSQQASAQNTFYCPEITLGVTAPLSQRFLARVEYDRVFGKSNIGVDNAEKNFLPNINTILFSIQYMFS